MEVKVKYSELQVKQTAALMMKTGLFTNYTIDDMRKTIIESIKALALQPGNSNMVSQYYYLIHGKRTFEDISSDANTMTANIYINPCILCELEVDYVGNEMIASDEEDVK